MAISEFRAALNQLASERNIKPEDVLESLQEAVIAAYRKDHEVLDEDIEKLTVKVDEETGEIRVLFDKKDVTPVGFGRIASQTAKQVILQKVREVEKESIAAEYRELIGTITQGYIFRRDREEVVLDLGKTHGVMPFSEQIPSEDYSVNMKYKVLIKDVTKSEGSSSAVVVSRKDPMLITALFKEEVPEMEKGIVKIESIAREAGSRTKVAVSSSDSKIDPSGACIGQRGVRVQAVTDELNGEKIDIINYSPDPDRFIAASLSPAHVIDVVLDSETKSALVRVSSDQQSLAIGDGGQNARLAAKLTGWKITVEGTNNDQESTTDNVEDPSSEVSA
jgi:transcription termination/antitermination protein NusA